METENLQLPLRLSPLATESLDPCSAGSEIKDYGVRSSWITNTHFSLQPTARVAPAPRPLLALQRWPLRSCQMSPLRACDPEKSNHDPHKCYSTPGVTQVSNSRGARMTRARPMSKPSFMEQRFQGRHPSSSTQTRTDTHCQAAGTKGHFYKMLLVSLSFQSLQTSESPLLFCQLCMPLLMLSRLVPHCSCWDLGPSHLLTHICSSRSNLETQEWRFQTSGFQTSKIFPFWCTSAGKEGKASWQANFNTFCRFCTNKWGIWSTCCLQTTADTLFFSANELKKQWVRAFQFFLTDYLGTICGHLLKGT